MRSAEPSAISSVASCADRLSTFGQAQISWPAASYSTMPSRMLVAATARTSAPVAPAWPSASAMQAADQPPVRGDVEVLAAGDAWRLGVDPFTQAGRDLNAFF